MAENEPIKKPEVLGSGGQAKEIEIKSRGDSSESAAL